ncbi:MAG TPA: hypothetical protein VFX12_02645 [Vicinamibacterales bacterium]|nr:hypothetical protein [Vicinamibacterales bacterium]
MQILIAVGGMLALIAGMLAVWFVLSWIVLCLVRYVPLRGRRR